MSSTAAFLRYASPNERRTISREDLAAYHAVFMGAIYEFSDGFPLESLAFYSHPVKQCVEKHPYMSVLVGDAHTEKPFYQRVPEIDLQQHISVVKSHASADDEVTTIEKLVGQAVDGPFTPGIPPWRVTITPLQQSRCFISYAYSHSIGDGLTGLVFHRTFLEACQNLSGTGISEQRVIRTPSFKLPDPFDTPERLPISWSYLLVPLLGLLLTSFIGKLLGVRADVTNVDANTWTGAHGADDPKVSHTKVTLREIKAPTLQKALEQARVHDTKLTGLLHQFIFRAFSRTVTDPKFTKFISQTPFNMRPALGISSSEMGNFVSACYTAHDRIDVSPSLSEKDWADSRTTTRQLAESAVQLKNQPLGLLRYVPSIRKWITGKFGQQRDCSFEVSNVGVFDASTGSSTKLVKMVFAQPGHVFGPPIEFNVATVKGGSLVYTVTWQEGALAVEGGDEDAFVEELCFCIQQDFEAL